MHRCMEECCGACALDLLPLSSTQKVTCGLSLGFIGPLPLVQCPLLQPPEEIPYIYFTCLLLLRMSDVGCRYHDAQLFFNKQTINLHPGFAGYKRS